jgi:DegV family protein with EDD domain
MSSDDYVNIFEPCLQQDDIIYICGSAYIFGLEELIKAKEILIQKYPDRKFIIVDSKNFSIGQGCISYMLALEYRKGSSIDEIENKSIELNDEVATYFIIDNAEQLYLNNLLPNNSISGTALNIKPILTVDIDGRFQVVDKASGKKKAVTKLISYIRQVGENVVDYPISIVYTDNENIAMELKEEILQLFGNDVKIFLSKMSPTNTSIIGRGVLGLSFHVHKKIH